MKNILFILFTVFIFNQCSIDDDTPQQHFEMLPVESISFPNEFVLNNTYTIEFTFLRPTNCHAYNNMVIIKEGANRTLGVNALVFENDNCAPLTTNASALQHFEFKVIYDQVYHFHVWKGKDAQGNDVYDDYDIPVIN